MPFVDTKGPHIIVVPHNLPSKFLLRMRRQDSAAAVAAMDQPPVLRQLFSSRVCEGLPPAIGGSHDCSFTDRIVDRTRLQTRASTAGDRTPRATVFTTRHANHSTAGNTRTGLHLRRPHEKRQTLLPPRPRSSALLATQRHAEHDSRQTDRVDMRVKLIVRDFYSRTPGSVYFSGRRVNA